MMSMNTYVGGTHQKCLRPRRICCLKVFHFPFLVMAAILFSGAEPF